MARGLILGYRSVISIHILRSSTHSAGQRHRHSPVVVNREGAEGQANLLDVVGATNALRLGFRASERGQQQCRQNGDDGNND